MEMQALGHAVEESQPDLRDGGAAGGEEREPPGDGYGGGSEMPLGAYAAIMALFNAALGGFLAAAWKSGRPLPDRIRTSDLVLLALATHKLSRLITKDAVTSPIR